MNFLPLLFFEKLAEVGDFLAEVLAIWVFIGGGLEIALGTDWERSDCRRRSFLSDGGFWEGLVWA